MMDEHPNVPNTLSPDDREFHGTLSPCRCDQHVHEPFGQETQLPGDSAPLISRHLCSSLTWRKFPLRAVSGSVDQNVMMIVPYFECRFAVPLEKDDVCILQKWDLLDFRFCRRWDITRSRLEYCFSVFQEVLKRCFAIAREEFEDENVFIGVRVVQKTIYRCLGQCTLTLAAFKNENVVDGDICQSLEHCALNWTLFDQYLTTYIHYYHGSKPLIDYSFPVTENVFGRF